MRLDARGREGGRIDRYLVERAPEDADVVGGAADEQRLRVGGQLDARVGGHSEDAVDVDLGGGVVVGGDDVVPVRVDRGRIGADGGRAVAKERDRLVGRVDPERIVLGGDGAVSGLGEDVLPGAALGALDPGLDRDSAGGVQGGGVRHADDVVDAVEGGGRVHIAEERAGKSQRDPVLVGAVVRARLVVGHRPRSLTQPPIPGRAVGEHVLSIRRHSRRRGAGTDRQRDGGEHERNRDPVERGGGGPRDSLPALGSAVNVLKSPHGLRGAPLAAEQLDGVPRLAPSGRSILSRRSRYLAGAATNPPSV
jgi:hypothetical protein